MREAGIWKKKLKIEFNVLKKTNSLASWDKATYIKMFERFSFLFPTDVYVVMYTCIMHITKHVTSKPMRILHFFFKKSSSRDSRS